MRLLPYGDDAWLLELSDPVGGRTDAAPAAVAERLRELPGLVQAVPGARTVLIEIAPGTDAAALRTDALRAASGVEVTSHDLHDGPVIEIEVRYDGADLDEVALATGMTARDVVALHCTPEYRVAFCGFAPGFAYLTGLDPVLHLPRHTQPRTAVPSGAVGIAGEFTGIYPRSSPGGWQVIGRTDAVLWDARRAAPALLPPGTRVRFVAIGR